LDLNTSVSECEKGDEKGGVMSEGCPKFNYVDVHKINSSSITVIERLKYCSSSIIKNSLKEKFIS